MIGEKDWQKWGERREKEVINFDKFRDKKRFNSCKVSKEK